MTLSALCDQRVVGALDAETNKLEETRVNDFALVEIAAAVVQR